MPISDLPTDAYTANAALGDLPSLRVTRTDTLTRESETQRIAHMYRASAHTREWPVCTYFPNGAVSLPQIDLGYGYVPLRALIQRWNRVMPPEWVASRHRARRGYFSRRNGVVRLTYRGNYHVDLGDGEVRFDPRGDIRWAGTRIYRSSIEASVAEQSGVEIPERTDNFEWPDWVGRGPDPDVRTEQVPGRQRESAGVRLREAAARMLQEQARLAARRTEQAQRDAYLLATAPPPIEFGHNPDFPGMCPEEHPATDGGCMPPPNYSCSCHLHSWDTLSPEPVDPLPWWDASATTPDPLDLEA